ncbi:thiopurine S-methyltransferase [Novimethylophilus kurashikiensis]|uniref:Thiopurine S-methyltransferase n=1 Tax=Novimethylophilus kurashikiensis TaxID=1825523 RepID=A0A2R5FC51_9PROT|nr:thiopurine S-methyltransferase [Novimethylophilus kurashikiensis]GBG15429.1 thiopurine S-methyltransferase [Novimethylophilus kurashikiensis]
MHHEFWHERWALKQIGFHQEDINPYLMRFWPALGVTGGRVFVPLCGKSRDMIWLREQGFDVVGVELSEVAVREFFEENGLVPVETEVLNFRRFEAGGYVLWCGDLFSLNHALLGEISAVYDRASLVALPPDMRGQYAAKLTDLLVPRTPTLLIAFEYPQHQMDGPPFSVTTDEVHALYGEHSDIELLHEENILSRESRFQAKGLERLVEKVYRLTRKN